MTNAPIQVLDDASKENFFHGHQRSWSDDPPSLRAKGGATHERSKSLTASAMPKREAMRELPGSKTNQPFPPFDPLVQDWDLQEMLQWDMVSEAEEESVMEMQSPAEVHSVEETQAESGLKYEAEVQPEAEYDGLGVVIPSGTWKKSPYPTLAAHVLSPTTFSPAQFITAGSVSRSQSVASTTSEHGVVEEGFTGTYSELQVGPRRYSTSTVRSFVDAAGVQSFFSPPLGGPSRNTYTSEHGSTIRSVQGAESYRPISRGTFRSSASSETIATRDHGDRTSYCSNWTLWPRNGNSTRPSSIDTRTPSPFGLASPREDLHGPRTQMSPSHPRRSKRRPISTLGNPLGMYLADEPGSRPGSASGSHILFGPRLQQTHSPEGMGAYMVQPADSRPSSAGSYASARGATPPPPLNMPKRPYRHDRPPCQPWSMQLPSIASSRIESNPKQMRSFPSAELHFNAHGSLDPQQGANASRPSIVYEASEYPSPTQPVLPEPVLTRTPQQTSWLRNPWQSVESMSFFGFGAVDGESRQNSEALLPPPPVLADSRPDSRRSGSNASTVIHHFARSLPAWARAYYAAGEPSCSPHTTNSPTPASSRPGTAPRKTSSPRSAATTTRSRRQQSAPPSRPTTSNTAPTGSPASSEFSIASVHRPRNRPLQYGGELDGDDDDNFLYVHGGGSSYRRSFGQGSYSYSHSQYGHGHGGYGHGQGYPLSRSVSMYSTSDYGHGHGRSRANSYAGSEASSALSADRPPPPMRPWSPSPPASLSLWEEGLDAGIARGTPSPEYVRGRHAYQQTPQGSRSGSRAGKEPKESRKERKERKKREKAEKKAEKAAQKEQRERKPRMHPKTKRQVWFFALGWLLPLLWVLGGMLGLPPSDEEEGVEESMEEGGGDLEKAIRERGEEARLVERKRARFWRNLNRSMGGMALVAVVIAVAVVVAILKS